MEIMLILLLIALIVGKREDTGVWKYVPHIRTENYENPHKYDVYGPDFGG